MQIKKSIIYIFLSIVIIIFIIIIIVFGRGSVEINTITDKNNFYTNATLGNEKITIPYKNNSMKPGIYQLKINRTDIKQNTFEIKVNKFRKSKYKIELIPKNPEGIIDEEENQ